MISSKCILMCLVTILPVLFLNNAEAKNCRKGIPCGNTCISANKVCRVGTSNSYTSNPSTTNNLRSYTNTESSSSLTHNSSSAASLASRTTSNSKTYNCTYSKAVLIGDAMGQMQGRFHTKVILNGDKFTAIRPDGYKLISPAMKAKNNGFYMEKDSNYVYVMAEIHNEYAVSNINTKETEQWVECK
ncbi:hypothetical protein MWU23_000607 [Proteus mirabilis]|uniref:Lipoprotein n=1 Tax=Proteus mirabilis TaxID=584 RepID=A0A7D5W2Y3_PROMI|nr:hypothetical protein [Proteus mirabilis]QLJ18252.1 hypothetical protein HZ283_14515 [Proteus mirabilis]